MEVNVKVTVDLGDRTMSLLGGVMAANNGIAKATDTVNKVLAKDDDEPAGQTTVAPAEKPAAPRSRRTKEQIGDDESKKIGAAEQKVVKVQAPKPEDDAASTDFASLSDEDKIDVLRTKVASHTKKGKSADIRFMLAQFDASTVSQNNPLKPEDYNAFNEALDRYSAGESVTDIFPELN